MVGLFEPVAAPWSTERIPDDFSFGEIPSNWDRLAPFLEYAMEILPGLADVGVRKLFTGPESFTPDNGFLMGEAPELDGFFVAAGFNSLGILTGGGAGSIMANWIVDGEPPVDVTGVDIARLQRWQTNRPYLTERSVELLGRLHSTGSWPNSQPTTARNVRRSPLHDRLVGGRGPLRRVVGVGERVLLRAGRRRDRVPVHLRPPRLVRVPRRRASLASARRWACSTCRRCRSSSCREPTPSRCSTGCRATTSPCRSVGACTRSG
jgi:hypothetical protein